MDGVGWLFKRAWRRIGPISALIAAAVLAIFGIVAGIKPEDYKWVLSTNNGHAILGVLFVLLVAGQIKGIFDTDNAGEVRKESATRETALNSKILQLQDDKETLAREVVRLGDNNRAMFEVALRHIAEQLKHTLHDRISVYEWRDGNFFCVGRYSQSPAFRKPGRHAYPDDQGVIGKAWRDGSAHLCDLPNAEHKPEKYGDEVFAQCAIPHTVSNKFKMKSRCLYAEVVLDEAGEEAVAVVVIESIDTQKVQVPACVAAIEASKLKKYLQRSRVAPVDRLRLT